MIDATVPLATAVGGKPTRVLGVRQGSAAQQAAELVPEGVDVVSALHTVSAVEAHRPRPHARRGRARLRRPQGPEGRGAELIGRIDGPARDRLRAARALTHHESLTALMISVNIKHKTHAGVRLTGV